ncbi:MAG: succinyl-diaminopimelate desuccinylase [Actinomycetes bacterium]
MAELDLSQDGARLTAALVDIASVSGDEREIADAVEAALRPIAHLDVVRIGDSVVARTRLGRAERVVVAGHLDTVPIADNYPSRLENGVLHGIGTADMKGGVAVGLRLAATVPAPVRDVTYVFYECEEVEAERNGLKRITDERPELLAADFAVLMEPTSATVEGGCQGTMRVDVATTGVRAHAARGWMGANAIHAAAPVLARLVAYEPREPDVEGLRYRESVNAIGIAGGVAGNVIPDRCVVTVNHRFAPDHDEAAAFRFLEDFFAGFELTLMDSAPGARPGLDLPAAASFVAAIGGQPGPKFGWTDVARFAQLGIAAVNYGPGNPNVAHARHEHVAVAEIGECETKMRAWLTAAPRPE